MTHAAFATDASAPKMAPSSKGVEDSGIEPPKPAPKDMAPLVKINNLPRSTRQRSEATTFGEMVDSSRIDESTLKKKPPRRQPSKPTTQSVSTTKQHGNRTQPSSHKNSDVVKSGKKVDNSCNEEDAKVWQVGMGSLQEN